ncbi:hypothetical protein [Kamptonema formosum]|uniref:hypothetical protein n=1 Tax=Kamptonema formosum TaxID=331992 RepID=UPI00034C9B83|nr:hypothetical protein [Oscillatoria sp. PCC 10802]
MQLPFPPPTRQQALSESANADRTFILTWDDRIKVKSFESLVRSSDQNQPANLELMALSTCQKAAGDSPCGFGTGARGGAFWRAQHSCNAAAAVSDAATGSQMAQFCRELAQPGVSKAEALPPDSVKGKI